MNQNTPGDEKSRTVRYFPAVLCAEYDSPIDALIALCVPRDEVMELVAASWSVEVETAEICILSTVDGGRSVAAIRTADRRWAACHAFPELACTNRKDAERQLGKLLKRGRQGYVAVLPGGEASAGAAPPSR